MPLAMDAVLHTDVVAAQQSLEQRKIRRPRCARRCSWARVTDTYSSWFRVCREPALKKRASILRCCGRARATSSSCATRSSASSRSTGTLERRRAACCLDRPPSVTVTPSAHRAGSQWKHMLTRPVPACSITHQVQPLQRRALLSLVRRRSYARFRVNHHRHERALNMTLAEFATWAEEETSNFVTRALCSPRDSNVPGWSAATSAACATTRDAAWQLLRIVVNASRPRRVKACPAPCYSLRPSPPLLQQVRDEFDVCGRAREGASGRPLRRRWRARAVRGSCQADSSHFASLMGLLRFWVSCPALYATLELF